MTTSSVTRRVVFAAAAYGLLFNGSGPRAQEVDLPQPVRTALAGYADLDPVAVTWSETTEAAPLGRKKIAAEVLDRITQPKETTLLAIRDGRMFLRRELTGGKSVKPSKTEIAFDRKVMYLGDTAKSPEGQVNKPTLSRWSPEKDQPDSRYFSDEFFRAIGVRLPTRVRELMPSWRPQSALLALLEQGGRLLETRPAELDGRQLTYARVTALDPSESFKVSPADLQEMEKQLRFFQSLGQLSKEDVQKRLDSARESQRAPTPRRQFDFYLDPERGFAVRRLDVRDEAGRLLTRSDCTEYEQIPGRPIWLPHQCRQERYTFVGLKGQVFEAPLFVKQFAVTAVDTQPWPYDRFALNYTTPGTRVSDRTFPEVGKGAHAGVEYEIPADAGQLDRAIQAARAQYRARGASDRPSRLTTLVVLNGLVLAGVVIFLLVWRLRRVKAG